MLLNPNRALGLRLHDTQQVAELALVPFEVDGCVRGLTRTVVACERLGGFCWALPGRPRVPPAWRTWLVEALVATDVP